MTPLPPEDAVIVRERDSDEVATHAFLGGRAAIFARRSPDKDGDGGSDGPNEDAAALIPFDADGGILVVADGAGGQRGGTQASSIALHELTASLEHAAQEGHTLREAILDGIESANREIATLGIGAATTLVVAEVRGGTLRPYHVGDSGILAVGRKGKLKLQTIFHSPTGYAVEAGLLNEREALQHDDRHLVSNVLGIPEMRIEMGSAIELAPHDTVLLASDGLFDNLRTSEIVELLRKGGIEQAVADLAQRAGKRMRNGSETGPSKPDDLTLIAFRREGDED